MLKWYHKDHVLHAGSMFLMLDPCSCCSFDIIAYITPEVLSVSTLLLILQHPIPSHLGDAVQKKVKSNLLCFIIYVGLKIRDRS